VGLAVVAVLAVAALALALTGRPADASGVDAQLVGVVWQWVEFEGPSGTTAVDDPSRFTVEFTSDGTVHAQADCNQGNGTYTAQAGKISIEIGAMTRAYCPEGDAFIQKLNNAATYQVEGGGLSLNLADGSGTMRLSADPPAKEAQVDPKLVGVVWQAFEFASPVDVTPIDDPSRYTVEFTAEGTVSILADCNRANGAYSADGTQINIEALAMTRAMCPPDSLSEQFVQVLNGAAVYTFQDGVLLLDLPADAGTLKLAETTPERGPQVDPNLVGKTWKWVQFTDPMDTTVVGDPDQYTVEFTAEGTVSILADCNRANGTYSADGAHIDIEALAMTRAMCPPDSLSDQFVQALNAAVIYFFQDGNLYMDLPMDSGTMQLSENPPQPEATPTPPQVDPNLVGKTWKWTQFVDPTEKTVIEDPDQYTVEFTAEGTVSILADCNRANGTYSADGAHIDIEALAMTRAMCPPGSLSDQFVQALNAAVIYFFQDGDLYMDLPMDSGTLKLAADPTGPEGVDPNLAGTWQWAAFASPVEQVTVDAPARYTVSFMEDGTVAVQADCNRATGTYAADGSRIAIELGPTTLAACPPDSLGDEFLRYLAVAAIYFTQDDSLYVDLRMDSGTMQFVPAPTVSPL
jgi:heat shock protein HslJ